MRRPPLAIVERSRTRARRILETNASNSAKALARDALELCDLVDDYQAELVLRREYAQGSRGTSLQPSSGDRPVMAEQLNLLGDAAQPVDGELGPVQRAAMRVLRRVGTMSWDEAGSIAHAHRGRHSVEETCAFCGTDGALLCESLVRRGLVEAHRHGYVRLPGGAGVSTGGSGLL